MLAHLSTPLANSVTAPVYEQGSVATVGKSAVRSEKDNSTTLGPAVQIRK